MKVWMLCIGFLFCSSAATGQTAPTTEPLFATRVMIVSFDGLRPDVALRAEMPRVRSLMARGSFTFWAHTTDVAITLPSHTSMLTGVTPDKHGIHWNNDEPDAKPPYPEVPTLFQLAKKQGRTTALVAGKGKFRVFDYPGALDWKFIKEATDDQVADAAAAIVHEHQPDVLFVHFPDCDRVGHALGWGTPQQVDTVTHADQVFGRVLDALNDEKLTDKTLIIVTADHGGNGKTHGGPDPRSQHIPWIAAGPGVRKNYDLTRDKPLVVATYDTFATACFVLGLPLPTHLDGKPVTAIFAHTELMHAAP